MELLSWQGPEMGEMELPAGTREELQRLDVSRADFHGGMGVKNLTQTMNALSSRHPDFYNFLTQMIGFLASNGQNMLLSTLGNCTATP
jgi:hypothetical protein